MVRPVRASRVAREAGLIPPPRWLMRSRWSERWVSSVWRSWARTFGHQYSIQKRFDRLIFCDLSDPVGRAMVCKGLWEIRQFEMMEREIAARRGDRRAVFLDVGAQSGLYSLYFQRFGGFDEIHAFEASPRNQVLLDLHLQMNGLEDAIAVHRVAVSDGPGEIDAAIFGSAARLRAGDAAIPAMALDDVLAPRDVFLVVKIDVDGLEDRVIEGMTGMLAANRVLMQIETLPDMKDRVLARLGALGLDQIGHVPRDDYLFASRD